jgi:hypothetical protein
MFREVIDRLDVARGPQYEITGGSRMPSGYKKNRKPKLFWRNM